MRTDLTGSLYGRLMVISENQSRKRYWNTECICGNEKIVRQDHLSSGRIKSCGCLNDEVRIATKTKHGMGGKLTKTPEYRSWSSMKTRCTNDKYNGTHNYKERGITFCERWDSFENFFEDMGRRPSLRHSLDRIDNDASYSPDNCRWATRKEQALNRRPYVKK